MTCISNHSSYQKTQRGCTLLILFDPGLNCLGVELIDCVTPHTTLELMRLMGVRFGKGQAGRQCTNKSGAQKVEAGEVEDMQAEQVEQSAVTKLRSKKKAVIGALELSEFRAELV